MADENLQDGRGPDSMASASNIQKMTDPYARRVPMADERLSADELEKIAALTIGGTGKDRLLAEVRASWAELETLYKALAALLSEQYQADRSLDIARGRANAVLLEISTAARARALVGSVPQPQNEGDK